MKPLLIGLAGRAGSGKDTVASIIKTQINKRGYSVKTLAFAEPLKKIVQEVYAFTDEQMTKHELKEAGDQRYPRPDGSFLSPREAMQKCGTEFARSCYPNTWSDFGIRRAKQLMKPGIDLSVVFTDCRFLNEAQAIRDAGGEVWRITRSSADLKHSDHASENEMNSREFNALVGTHVHNNDTLEYLVRIVKECLR